MTTAYEPLRQTLHQNKEISHFNQKKNGGEEDEVAQDTSKAVRSSQTK